MAESLATRPKGLAWVQSIRDYIKDTQVETRRVIWPARKYVISATIVILLIVVIVGALLMGIDLVLSYVMGFLLQSGRSRF